MRAAERQRSRVTAPLAHRFTSEFKPLSVHPVLRPDLCEPVLRRRNSSQVFLNMLFSEIPHWDFFPFTVRNGHGEDLLIKEIAFRAVTKDAVAKVGKERLRLIKPAMHWQVVFGLASKSLRATLRMLQGVCHDQNSLVS